MHIASSRSSPSKSLKIPTETMDYSFLAPSFGAFCCISITQIIRGPLNHLSLFGRWSTSDPEWEIGDIGVRANPERFRLYSNIPNFLILGGQETAQLRFQ